MELKDVLAALRASWWLLLVGLLLGGACGMGLSLIQTPQYTSHTQFFVKTTDAANTSEVFQGGQFSQERVTSYADLLTGVDLAGEVVERLDLPMTPTQLTEKVTATAVAGTVLIDVTVTDPSPERAQAVATALGAEFQSLVTRLERPNAATASPVRVTVTQRPELPDEPSSPKTIRNIAIGLLGGLAAGSAAAVLRARLDRSVHDPELAGELAEAPVIGVIPRDDTLRRSAVGMIDHGRTAEAFRQLRTNLQFLNVDHPPRVIMVTSAVPAEGKSTIAVNLALALAEAGRQVTLVDADLRRPSLVEYLDLIGGVGLTNVLTGSAELGEVMQVHGESKLAVLGAGPTPPNPSQLLASRHMVGVLDRLRASSDYVVIDAPPLLPVADATGLAVMVDGVVLAVRSGRTEREELRSARASLDAVRAQVLGVVLNVVPPRSQGGAAHEYDYAADHEPLPRTHE